MPEIDLDRAPLGVLAAQALIASVTEKGDLAERHYLELKSTLDLSTKKDKEKIAKFILGAANRMPEIAASAFGGYAVMLVGVEKGASPGIVPVEMMEISKIVQHYVGAAGPHWDIVWVPTGSSTNQVLMVLVDPPRAGQGPFPCRANGESLTNGRIYVRADGETREATADEVELLVQRAHAEPSVEVRIDVEVLGEVATYNLDDESTIEAYIDRIRRRLLSALPSKPDPEGSFAALVSGQSDAMAKLMKTSRLAEMSMSEPENRTEPQYLGLIEAWEAKTRAVWSSAVAAIVGGCFQPALVRVTNRTTTFFHDVELKLHLAGSIRAVDYRDPEYIEAPHNLDLPDPPRKWGPRPRDFGIPTYQGALGLPSSLTRAYTPPSISYRNGGSVTLDLTVGDLRPRGVYVSEEQEIVLVVEDPSMAEIHGTWEFTARGHNQVYTGDFAIEVGPAHDLTEQARQILRLTAPGS